MCTSARCRNCRASSRGHRMATTRRHSSRYLRQPHGRGQRPTQTLDRRPAAGDPQCPATAWLLTSPGHKVLIFSAALTFDQPARPSPRSASCPHSRLFGTMAAHARPLLSVRQPCSLPLPTMCAASFAKCSARTAPMKSSPPLEAMALDWVRPAFGIRRLLCPRTWKRALARDYSVEGGQANPFLHLSMHLSISEQISIHSFCAASAPLYEALGEETRFARTTRSTKSWNAWGR